LKRNRSLFLLAIVLLVVGILLTLENFDFIAGVSLHWPLFLLITGTGFILLFVERDRGDDALLWLGSFMAQLGVFFYVLNFTSWNALGVWWPVFLGLVGVSFLTVGVVRRNYVFTVFGIAFVGLFFVFTLVFTVSMKLWPMSMAIFGACLLLLDYLNRTRSCHG
jgi:hypothetical protein